MLSIPRVAARRYWAAFRQLLTGVPRRTWPGVQLFADQQGLRIAIHTDKVGLELRLPGAQSPATLTVPCELLQTVADSRGESVPVEPGSDGAVIARWRDGDVPRQATFDVRPQVVADRPSAPASWSEQPADFLPALHTVMQVTDPESLRYALSCVRLDGDAGTLTATDGRQILSHGGWRLGFTGSVLVPANKVFGHREFTAASRVRIGGTDTHFVVEADDWTVRLALNVDGRFPAVNDLLGATDAAVTRLTLATEDRQFLRDNLPRLPEQPDDNHAVTVDLNGRVAIRACDREAAPPTELVLNRSSRVGPEVRFATDRRYLSRALELGFGEIAIQSAEQPVACRDDRRTYVWALLTPDGAIGPTGDASVIESAPDEPSSASDASLAPSLEKSKTMITTRLPPTSDASHDQPAANGAAEPASIDALIDSAERVKSVLRDATSQVTDLIVALRRHRRQSKTLQSALSSLRALQALDA